MKQATQLAAFCGDPVCTDRAPASRKHFGVLTATLLVCAPLLTAASQPPPAPAISPPATAAPPDDGQWTMPAKNYASTRYSELAEINEGNVKNLQVAFTFSTGVNKGQEAAPLVIGNTMYIVTPFPNIVYALDLSKPGAPMKWKYEPNPEPAAQGVACCDVVTRGAAFADGRVFFNTLDGHTIALDANSGQPIWNAHIANINIGETITMAPLVVKGKVLVGNSGGEMGVRGWVKALDAGDGHVVWTAYNTGPDKEVLIGPDFKPHYDMDKGKDLGVTTWPPEAWKIGGGNMWGWISYDPDLNLIFHGTGNPGPWNPDLRPGDNKWTSGIFARDADTGAAKWFYQWTPHDLHDYDGINEQVLLDMNWQGKPRKVLVRPERNGYLYVLDRTTGEVLSAKPYGPVNSSKGVDLKTGRLIENPDKLTGTGKVVRDICPTASGLKDWQPSAFSPKTGLLYIPHNNLCMDEEGVEVNYIAGTPYVGMNVRMIPGPGGNRGAFTAWDIAAEKPAWSLKENFPVWSGAVVTAGDVVFYGTMEGWFKAVSAKTGDLLWQFKTSSGIIGQPITYRGPDGHQYVAILSGVGGWAGAIVSGDLDPRDATAALGFVNVMKDLKNTTTAGGTLYVFRLP
ncbi:PQQ-dependent dehydrogenase, methanol/ethanol family [Mesorhizobium sp. M2D.F.Ca.ET.185.01.1.1]|uniref:methanol/ethanol family PQQ-dependent dehydrogenase n=1 Tax=unclassified Mesorhizobium TaxID=325217 RepID=UPI000FCAE943|nr:MULTISPECIES: methanol/ethanol family PQQ-dependent dehydrogenase [unclassified Mesorhizobium]TGP55617.1 PQQ-dependent dehydrogenase, methanol/ethanol family [bacterium M00.F.Ca.ET.230.01.1.1]TGP82775.1 PQQ-dependent dehydrogenase, methanol/ethanol family [bacterium M00.F.Ca.ET.227.01.1.1]TGP94519.1 PQQ-dependent dehydrogenase, methanol/ethanol family [bacterium M00.F.Ca.ET.221.01.1.1]TGP97972.1 PQQ-dependent dehydrogenase, methanol/ethanol family [bacterium M00.F.Ca.ET.222.01.1.1]TGT96355.